MNSELNEYDIKMLGILKGNFPDEKWGAWWTPCLEFLAGMKLCSKGPNYQITEQGKKILERYSYDQ